MMTRGDVVRAVIEFRGDAAMIVGPGKSTAFLYAAPLHPATIYNMELAYAVPMALGIALSAREHRVIALEGDGSMFAGAQALGTIARYSPKNLTVVVLANTIWGTSDGTVKVTLAPEQYTQLAIACGWPSAYVVFAAEAERLRDALRTASTEPGPWFIVAQASPSSEDASVAPDGRLRERPRPPLDTVEAVSAMRRFLAGLPVIGG